jgi:AcrR family transcriptional regulator
MTNASTLTTDTEETDGRRRRSQDSRARVVAAMLDLVRNGDVAPSAERVAARAEVGLRTVFRHFKDMDSLYREMSVAVESELATALATPLKGEDWRARLRDLIRKRGAVYETITPYKLASNVHRHQSSFLEAAHDRMVSTARATLVEVLPDQVRKEEAVLAILELLLSFESWSRLRQEQGQSVQRAREILEIGVLRMIDTTMAEGQAASPPG